MSPWRFGGGAKVAHAGQWVFEGYEPNGKTATNNSTPAAPGRWTGSNTSGSNGFSTGTASNATYGGSAWCEASGKVTPVFRWLKYGYPGEPAEPPILYVKVTASAHAYGINGAVLTVDNGIGSPTVSSPAGGLYNTKDQSGAAYFQIATKGATLVKIPMSGINLKARSEIANGPTSSNDINVQVGLSATATNCWMRIDNSDIEPSFHNDNGTKTPDVPKDDGGKQTTSVVSWNSMQGFWNFKSNNFNAVTTGFTNPQYAWSYSGAGKDFPGAPTFDWPRIRQDPDRPAYAQTQINFEGTDDLSDPSALSFYNSFPKTGTIKVRVTDSANGAVADSTFDITWHLPIDQWKPNGQRTSVSVWENNILTGIGVNETRYYTPSENRLNLSTAAGAGELFCNVGSSVASAIPGVKTVGVVGAGLLSAGGWTLGQVPPPTQLPMKNDWAKWQDAVATQQGINNGTPGTQRLFPPSMATPSTYNDFHRDPTTDKDYQDSTMSLSIRKERT